MTQPHAKSGRSRAKRVPQACRRIKDTVVASLILAPLCLLPLSTKAEEPVMLLEDHPLANTIWNVATGKQIDRSLLAVRH